MHRLTRLIDRKMGQGKRLQGVLLLVLQKFLTPTPAMGFILGAVATMAIGPFAQSRIGNPFVTALTFGTIIAVFAAVFQRVHDNYWGKHE